MIFLKSECMGYSHGETVGIFISYIFNYLYSHTFSAVLSVLFVLILFFTARVLTGKTIGMGDIKLYTVIAVNAETNIIYVIMLSMIMWLPVHIIKKSDTKTALGPFISLSYAVILNISILS